MEHSEGQLGGGKETNANTHTQTHPHGTPATASGKFALMSRNQMVPLFTTWRAKENGYATNLRLVGVESRKHQWQTHSLGTGQSREKATVS